MATLLWDAHFCPEVHSNRESVQDTKGWSESVLRDALPTQGILVRMCTKVRLWWVD